MVINGKSLIEAMPIKDMLINKVKLHGVSHGLAEVGYDICLKQDVWFEARTLKQQFQMCHRTSQERLVPKPGCTRVNKPRNGWFGGRFTLASTMEEFDMPNDLVGIVHDKSTWARKGLSVFNTVIEPGWSGFLTLELVYHGSEPLIIPAGSGIAQVIFHRIAQPAAYTGKYQSQADKPVPSVFE